jgi:predicted 3-demethylubiquinone-9 3-methyltransferase (glyoxalase superfamily)
MNKISPCLWFAKEAEEAANYYVSLLPESHIVHVQRSPSDYPGGKEGDALVVYFMLAGQSFIGLNGGMKLEYNNSVSFSIDCKEQAEIDQLWSKILKDGGHEQQCGWINDKYNVPWQIVPADLQRMMADHDPAKAKRVFEAMMTMVKLDIAALHKAYVGD